MLTWILICIGALALVVLAVAIIGSLLPKSHIASRRVQFKQSPQVIFDAITDWKAFPTWRDGVKSVKERAGEGGRVSWIEGTGVGEIPLEIIESSPPRKLLVKIADPKLPFGGVWTYEIEPTPDGGATLTITENGEVYNPIFRFMSRFIFGYTATMDAYQKSLGRKFGQEVKL